ncbi:hypothetical protein OSTOST_07848, partial [Ostertagia ostertagi]
MIHPDYMILQHDAQLNFFGNRLATCSSDRIVKIFEVRKVIIWSENNGRWQKSHEWTGMKPVLTQSALLPIS